MLKILENTVKRLSFVFLISAVFLSIPQQKVPFNSTQTVTCSETLPAIYPKLNYSTFLGGDSGDEYGRGIATTNNGSYYVTGHTDSNDFPTQDAYNNISSGECDVFITKFNSINLLIWSTYFGGSDSEYCLDVAVGGDGSCYITGFTSSSDFPTKNAYNSTYSGNYDVFLAKFASNGLLLWSTFLGGSNWDRGHNIAVAADGSCYVTGETQSSNFPTKNAYDSTYNGLYIDAFVAKFTANGSLLWSTFLGGSEDDEGHGLAVTSDGSCYVTGLTSSTDFPMPNGYDTSLNGYYDVYVTKLHSNGTILWSTYLGGYNLDIGHSIAATNDDSCYVTGDTWSSDFPTQHAYNSTYGGADAFLAKFAANGLLLWSTFLGGNSIDHGYDIAVAAEGSCYLIGFTKSSNFPTKNAYNSTYNGNYDVFLAKFASNGLLLWSTYLGGSDDDEGYGITTVENGSCYVIGITWSTDFPTLNAYDNTTSTYSDIFITKFVDTPLPSTPSYTVDGFLAFKAVMPLVAFLLIIKLIFFKKRK